ncbi:MAG: hypothetical protein ACOZAA_11465 [Pseudomonadota bacterium]
MTTCTHTLELDAPSKATFNFLSNIENLPRWATIFCRELKSDMLGRRKVVTPDGEIFFSIKSDRNTGVIDMYGGPATDQMMHWPTRVVDRPGKGSLFIFTAMQYPGVPDDAFEKQCGALLKEFAHIRRHVDGV